MSTVQFMNRFLSNVSNVEINHAELYSEKEQALLDDAEKIKIFVGKSLFTRI